MSDNYIGATKAVFTASLSVAVGENVDVDWLTHNGSATAGDDYEASSGTVTFAPGETVKQFEVIVYGQEFIKQQKNKNFFVELSPPINAVLNSSLLECIISIDGSVSVLSIIVPQGKRGFKGDPGLSAYEQAVFMGYEGTLEDWMAEIADASNAAGRAEAAAAAAKAAAEAAAEAAAYIERAEIPDSRVKIWSDRTQEEKNKENPSAQDFGAKGDGVTNDTQSFINFEKSYQGRTVDLLGKTYLVDAAPKNNIYKNGLFKVGTKTTRPYGEFIRNGNSGSTPINVRQDIRTPKLVGSLSRVSGRGSGNVVQSICIDDTNGYWYTLSAHESLGSFINRFKGFSYIGRSALDKSDYHPMLGHQGLCMEYRGNDGEDRLWTSVGYEPSPPAGYAGKTVNYALSFIYKKIEDGLIDNTEFWKVYDDSVSGNGSSTPTISVDGRFLITRAQITDGSGSYRNVRIWDMKTIREHRKRGDYDISKVAIADWRYYPSDYIAEHAISSNQHMACDGSYVYVAEGHNSIENPVAYILIFDLLGNHIDTVDIKSVGYDQAVAVNTNGTGLYELEGMQVVKNVTGGYNLVVQYAMGISGYRNCFVYELGASRPLRLINDQDDFPYSVLYGNSKGVDVAYLSTRGYKQKCIRADGSFSENYFAMSYDGAVMIGTGFNPLEPYSVVGAGIGGAQHLGIGESKGSAINVVRSDNSILGARWQMVKSRGTTNRESAAVRTGDSIGLIDFIADDGASDWGSSGGVVGARIYAKVSGIVEAGKVETDLLIANSSGSSKSSPTLRWVFKANGGFAPYYNNECDIGEASTVVKDLFLQNAPIVTSDERYKSEIRKLSSAELECAKACAKLNRVYKLNDAIEAKGIKDARNHIGTIAQLVIQTFTDHGLDWREYGIVTYEEWVDKFEPIIEQGLVEREDEVGNLVSEHVERDTGEKKLVLAAGNKFSVRYDEFNCFVNAGLEAHLSALEDRLSQLEAK